MYRLMTEVVAGDCRGFVGWDPNRCGFIALIDVFGLLGRRHTGPVGLPGAARGGLWWDRSDVDPAGRQAAPVLRLGLGPDRHFTIDSLLNELDHRRLGVDVGSVSDLVALREAAALISGEAVVAIDDPEPLTGGVGPARKHGGGGRQPENCRCWAEQSGRDHVVVRLDTPCGRSLVVPPMLAPSCTDRLPEALPLADAADRLVSLAWNRRDPEHDSIVLEVGFEILGRPRPFAVTLASIGDWIAHGSGLRWREPFVLDGRQSIGRRFRQLTLDL